MKNPIRIIRIKDKDRYFNTLTGRFLSDRYGRRLHLYFERFPDTLLKEARGHWEQISPDEVPVPEGGPAILGESGADDCTGNGGLEDHNLRIWSWETLRKAGYL